MTDVAFKWSIISVCSLVDLSNSKVRTMFKYFTITYPQIPLLGVLFATNFAVERSLSSVSYKMSLHRGDTNKLFTTDPAHG